MATERKEKILRLGSRSKGVVNIVREHYLRDDVVCSSELLPETVREKRPCLPADVTHYIVPDCKSIKHYFEIFDLPEFSGLIVTQTAMNYIKHRSSRNFYLKIRQHVSDLRRQWVVFSNEHCRHCYDDRQPNEPMDHWETRLVHLACSYLYELFEGRMPIVMICDNAEFVATFKSATLGVFILSMRDYLMTFWSDLAPAHELWDSLSLSLSEQQNVHSEKRTIRLRGGSSRERQYCDHLGIDELEAGIKSGRYLLGRLKVSKRRPQHEAQVYIHSESSKFAELNGADEPFVFGPQHRNRAVDRDMVVVELLPKSAWGQMRRSLVSSDSGDDAIGRVVPSAKVVGILQRSWREYVASISEEKFAHSKGVEKILVVPYDVRIPKIRITTRQAAVLLNQRIVVRIDSWETDSLYPNGHFVKSLGPIGNVDTETAVILTENAIKVGPFSEKQMKELPVNTSENPWQVSVEEQAKRRDLRKSHLIFSIDPIGCEDVDDTLSVRQLRNGNIELGVHIADVSYFVPPNSQTDLEARARGTTVYLADRRYDMLPTILSADLCSLLGGVDRYAMSVIWELNSATYDVKSVWYGRTLIKSAYKLYYEAAQDILNDQKSIDEYLAMIPELRNLPSAQIPKKLSELRWCITKLTEIARVLRERRDNVGALELEGVEVRVQIGEKNTIEDLVLKNPLEVHETVAECMIFANHWVAKRIEESFPTRSLLRRHPSPRKEGFSRMIEWARSKGFDIDVSSNKALADSLNKAVDPNDPQFNKLLRTLAIPAMSRALYFSTGAISEADFYHYGLALDRYTHFTSPIRRYADLVVHRLLMAAVNSDCFSSEDLLSNVSLQDLCSHINERNEASQCAQRDSVEMFKALYFRGLEEDSEKRVAECIVLSLWQDGVGIFIPKFGIKGPLYLKNKEDLVVQPSTDGTNSVVYGSGSLIEREDEIEIVTLVGTYKFRLFDHYKVRISLQSSSAHTPSFRFELLSLTPLLSSSSATQATDKTDVVKEIKDDVLASKKGTGNKTPEPSILPSLKADYGQTSSETSLYHVLSHFHRLALTADDK